MQAYRFNQNLEMCTKITNLALKLHHFVGSLSQICWDLAETITAICTNSSTTKSHFQGTSYCILLHNYACTCLTFYSCPMKYGYTRSIAHKLTSKAGQNESSWSTECWHWPVHELKCPKFLSNTEEYKEAKGRGHIIHSNLVFPMYHYVVFLWWLSIYFFFCVLCTYQFWQ